MKQLKIRNVGPLKEVDIDLKRINVIIGPQGSGKSCVLKIACYCSWVEKRIVLEQSCARFYAGGFKNELERFHKLDGYIGTNSVIEYESELMYFQYNGASDRFVYKWKGDRWDYKRSKICFIPAERNMTAVIPNWFEVEFLNNNIRNFLKDWENIRKSVGDLPILNLGVKYHYNPDKGADEVKVGNNVTVNLTNASSGFQSVIPVCALLEFFFIGQFSKENGKSVETYAENAKIAERIFNEFTAEKYGEEAPAKLPKEAGDAKSIVLARMGHYFYPLYGEEDAKKCERYYYNFTTTDHSDIFLEEPELSLFPATQYELLKWIVGKASSPRQHSIFIATHSPYILAAMNNLIEAGNVIAEHVEKLDEVKKIVPKESILSSREVGAFMIGEDCVVRSMMDDESGLILSEALDGASDLISEEFDKLLEL